MPKPEKSKPEKPEPEKPTAAAGSRATCPICGAPRQAAYTPFCSKRCADVDLNRWLRGVYAVPAAPAAEEGDDEPENGGRHDPE